MHSGAYAQLTAALEEQLGDPFAGGPLGFAAAMAREEAGAFPAEAAAALHAAGLTEELIPTDLGGRMTSLEGPMAVVMALARRDPAVALTFGFKGWSMLIWLLGRPEQRVAVAERLRAGELISMAISEAERGADLVRSDLVARPDPAGFRLSGRKWPIGAGARAANSFVLARTGEGPRGLSFFWLRSDAAAPGAWRGLPPVRTAGMRAAEVSGFELEGVLARPEDLIGRAGRGLELTLKLFQATRPLVTGVCLGIGDSALRLAAGYAGHRALYGRRASDLGAVRDLLVGAWVDLLIAEAVTLCCLRGLHVAPHEGAMTSVVTKALVPTLVAGVLERSTAALGARSQLREGLAHGVFQKLRRDHGPFRIFDGSTEVCTQDLAGMLPGLLDPHRDGRAEGRAERVRRRADLTAPLEPLAGKSLQLDARGADDLLRGLPRDALTAPIHAGLEALRRAAGADRGEALRHCARRYAQLHAAAACYTLHAHARQGSFAAQPAWLELALHRTLHGGWRQDAMPEAASRAVLAELLDRVERPRTLSLFPVPMPGWLPPDWTPSPG